MECCLLRLFLLIFITFSAFAVKPASVEDDVDFSPVERLNVIRKARQLKVNKTRVERIQRNTKPRRETKMQQIISSELIDVAIVAGTELIKFESNQRYVTKHNLTLKIYAQTDDFGFFYVKQKNNLVKFKVHRTKVTFLNQVTQMYEPPEIYTPKKFEKKLEFFDKNLYTSHAIGLDYEFVNSKFTSEVLGEKTAITGIITGYSYTFLTDWDFPIDFGVTAKLENTSFDEGFYDYITNRTFLISGTFKSKTIWVGTSRYKVAGKIGRSLLSRLTTRYLGGVDRFDLQTYTFELGVERHFENFLGSFAIGLSYKKRWIQLEDSTSSSFINDLNTNDTSYGVYFAQRFGKER
jgi:hypothetical protein